MSPNNSIEQPVDIQLWLLTLTSPAAVFNSYVKYNEPQIMSDDFEAYKESFKEQWGIENARDMHRMIKKLANGQTHGPCLQKELNDYRSYPRSKWIEYKEQLTTTSEKIEAQLSEMIYPIVGSGGIRAWDYVRSTFLLRSALQLGWASEEEYQFIMTHIGRQAQHYFRSWEQYSQSYYIGRTYWLYDMENSTPENIQNLLDGEIDYNIHRQITIAAERKESPIHWLPWYVELPEVPYPESLNQYGDSLTENEEDEA